MGDDRIERVPAGSTRKFVKQLLKSLGVLSLAREVRDAALSLQWLKTNTRYWIGGAPDGLPVPPLTRVRSATGTSSLEWSFHGGALAAKSIRDALARNGVDMNGFRALLDFGCGYGRVLRHWSGLRAEIHGSDYNPSSIRWCRRNLRFATFEVNALEPPLSYADNRFDFVYALSVFTHLPRPLLKPWMSELSRILIPGGHLLITTHGEAYMSGLTPEEQDEFRRGSPVVRNADVAGTNHCGVYFSEAYIRGTLASGFEVLEFVPQGALGNPHQDLVLLRKPVVEHT
jgi:SAM-dependent methyltransferase